MAVPAAYLGASQEEIDKHAIYETYKVNLAHLRLLRVKFQETQTRRVTGI